MNYIWEQRGLYKQRTIEFTGGLRKPSRYVRFLKFFNVLLGVGTVVVAAKCVAMYFGV